MRIEPKRVLDIGVGFGRWGMTLREFAEVWFDRVRPEEWTIEIEGIEAFERNIVDYHDEFYDRIHIGDALDVLPEIEGGWSLAILGDVLEHFYKSDGEKLLADLVARSDYVLVNLPIGDDWPQEDKYENPYEEHKAVWELEDFDPDLVCAKQTFLDFQERPFASVILSRKDPRDLRLGLFGSPLQGEAGGGASAQAVQTLDFDDAHLVDRVRERIQALESIRASGAWRMVNRARNNPVVWGVGRALRRVPGDRWSLRNLDGGVLRLLRIESDGTPILWDFLQRRGSWSPNEDDRAAFGESPTSMRAGDSVCWYDYGAGISVHLLGGPEAGRCRLTVGGRRFDLDLRRPRNLPLVFDGSEQKLFERDVPVPLVPESAEDGEVTLTQTDRALVERLLERDRPVLAVYPPSWTGIRNSTLALFDLCHPLPERLDSATRDGFLRLVEASGCQSLVFSGGALDHLHLAREISERSPETTIRVLWHGSFLQAKEEYAWRGLRLMTDLARRGVIHAIGFVKEGMAEVYRRQGIRAGFVLNYVEDVPDGPSQAADGGPHFGMWISNEGWRKIPYAMAAATVRIDGANLHFNGERKRLVEFSRLIGLKTQRHGEGLFGREELLKWMRLMDLNLYVTLSECCPMLPLESLSVGTPCLLGPSSHLFRDDRYLFDRLVVPFPDSSDAIHEKAVQALDEREEIVEAYRAWVPSYNERAKRSVQAFLDL